jgi:hypothetical protein
MSCDDECAVEKAEAKEWAYFSGITTGRNGERERVIKLFQNEQYRFGKAFVDEIIQIIKGEKK